MAESSKGKQCQLTNEARTARIGITTFACAVSATGDQSEARTKRDAEQAELKIKQEVFEGRFGLVQSGKLKLDKFIDEIYLPSAKPINAHGKGMRSTLRSSRITSKERRCVRSVLF